jgi:hypothetical protein
MTFDEFDSLIRLDLQTLKRVTADFQAIRYGYDNRPNGLYNGCHGNVWYIGPQLWPRSEATKWSFLTTEALTTKVVEAVFRLNHRQLFTFTLPDIPDIHPIKVPVVIDPRAAADQGGKPKVSALAAEIVDANPDAYVISDGVKDVDRVLTFQKAKGFNGLEDKDVYIILTNLAPAKYEELNVLGQWLDIPGIISMFYQDQLNQAVGRNRGFRQSTTRNTRCVVITTKRLYESVISKLGMSGRVQLYRSDTKEW